MADNNLLGRYWILETEFQPRKGYCPSTGELVRYHKHDVFYRNKKGELFYVKDLIQPKTLKDEELL